MRPHTRSRLVNELQAMLQPYSLKITEADITRWAKLEVIPDLSCYLGNRVLWRAEVAAAAYLINRHGFSEGQLRVGRSYMVGTVEGQDNPIEKLDQFWQEDIEALADSYKYACEWFLAVVKFLLAWPADAPIEITAHANPKGGYTYSAMANVHDYIHLAGQVALHPRPVPEPGEPQISHAMKMQNQILITPEALAAAVKTALAGLRQEIADLKTAIDGSVQKLDKTEQAATEIEERLCKLEAQAVVPPNLALKIQERTSPDAEKAGSRLALPDKDGKIVALDESRECYGEIEPGLKKPNLDKHDAR